MGFAELRRKAAWHVFKTGQRIGVDVLPRHFYSAVPDLQSLRDSTAWRVPRLLAGINGTDLDSQVESLRSWFSEEISLKLRSDIYDDACARNGAVGYGPIEAEILFAFIASQKPHRVVQVGAGVGTAIILAAADFVGHRVELLAIDPFPTPFLIEASAAGEIDLLVEPAQAVDLSVFTGLKAGDLLFVDSTHTVKPNSEVNRIILDILPSLEPGVIAHFHDITLPFDYFPDMLDGRVFQWNETALLHAFLINNDKASLLVSTSMIHHEMPAVVSELVPRYRPMQLMGGLKIAPGHYPSATYVIFR